ncbi:phosphoribosylformylglycinamidine synthase subunit PurS [Bartonella apis]|uniref:phosphoribosylformylglycinamidine synthase subunit PurS n=1 Tax=Bartonella apis TaxID=1686310 RepID=UPI000960F374|nr:phosphoribosylformylglycinamidine synthase subunit PurS [Bartonella apis]OLY47235.1 phosphoribosylformylglycinamidine synthase [Bartonella apis]
MEARVTVTLKAGVLDPQGKAIVGALDSLDFKGVQSVRQGKVFDIVLDDLNKDEAKKQLKEMCEQLLANTVIENYQIELL